ncbi:hypothetical protein ACPCAC_06740 [Streptomyces lavendulocolor]|uniref:hypothetical protein n=1 Tax=Streptomyces lavendulocolor TaxID=67316 RepID=UPI003C2D9FF6
MSVLWSNFIGRSHEGIVEARDEWEKASFRFGEVDGCPGDRLLAPDRRPGGGPGSRCRR